MLEINISITSNSIAQAKQYNIQGENPDLAIFRGFAKSNPRKLRAAIKIIRVEIRVKSLGILYNKTPNELRVIIDSSNPNKVIAQPSNAR